jgi:carbon-monoxide dehydrogenase medium subunit
MICQTYFQPRTIEEVLDALRQGKGRVRILAGGTDLMIDLQNERKQVQGLVDISRVDGLNEIRIEGGIVRIGAGATHAQASRSELLREEASVLSEACSTVGSPQIRNLGTLVGNIVNAMPAADGAMALVALGAGARVLSCADQGRFVPVEQLYQGPGQSVIDSTQEFIPYIEFPIPGPRSGSSFQRLSRRKALALPVLNAAVFLRLDESLKTFEEVRIAIGPVSPVPFRSKGAEALLEGASVSEEAIERAGEIASEEASPRTSLRGGKEYRKEMVKVLVERGLRQSLRRLRPEFFNG